MTQQFLGDNRGKPVSDGDGIKRVGLALQTTVAEIGPFLDCPEVYKTSIMKIGGQYHYHPVFTM